MVNLWIKERGVVEEESILSTEAQREVDRAIEKYGLKGLGYYYVLTCCDNCKKKGIGLFKYGESFSDRRENLVCVHCWVEQEIYIRAE